MLSNRWHHVVARFDGAVEAGLGRRPRGGRAGRTPARCGPGPPRSGSARPVRTGVATAFLDADLAMPAIYGKALSPAEIAARFADRGSSRVRPDPTLLACWPLDEERGDRAADASPHGRHARIINQGTWMIGGPELRRRRAPVRDVRPREGPSPRPRPAAGFRRSLRLPMEGRRTNIRLPGERPFGHLRRPDPLPARRRGTALSHACSSSKKAAARPKAPIAFLCSTNTWRAYAATPFSPTWPGIKKSIGNNGFANSPGDPPAFCFYRPHHAGQGTYQIGFRMPWPIVGPYTLMGPEEWDYSHLCRQDRFTQVWLETQGYDYDVLSDTDLHLDPHVLDGYRVLFVVGHSEYWSFEAMEAVEPVPRPGRQRGRALGEHGVLAGVVQCRRDASSSAARGTRRGPRSAPTVGARCGTATTAAAAGCRANAASPPGGCSGWSISRSRGWARRGSVRTRSATPTISSSAGPIDLKLRDGRPFGGTPGRPLPQPIGHEGDVAGLDDREVPRRAASRGRRRSRPRTRPASRSWPRAIADSRKVAFAWDYFQRPVPLGKAPPISVAAEMIYWERPGGGRVFHAGSINAGSTLAARPEVGRPAARTS